MSTAQEARVAQLARSFGLALQQPTNRTNAHTAPGAAPAPAPTAGYFQLVSADTRIPVYPGSAQTAATLAELEDWLRRPWE